MGQSARVGAVVGLVGCATVAVFAACVGDAANTTQDAGVVDTGTPDTSGGDAAIDSGKPTDAAATCDLTKPFSAPELVPGVVNSTAIDGWLFLLPDLLTALSSSTRPLDGGFAGVNVYSLSRLTTDAAFGQLTPLSSLNGAGTGQGVDSPLLTADGLTVYLTNGSTGNYDVMVATRTTTALPFGAPQLVAAPVNVNGGGAGEDWPVWVSPDGATLYLSSNRAGSNGRDVYVAVKGGNGFGTPTAVAAVNSAGNDMYFTLTPDELQGFLNRDNQIYYTSRTTKSAGFSPPVAVAELNSAGQQNVTWVSADGCTVYLSSSRPGGFADAGSWDIYVATRGK